RSRAAGRGVAAAVAGGQRAGARWRAHRAPLCPAGAGARGETTTGGRCPRSAGADRRDGYRRASMADPTGAPAAAAEPPEPEYTLEHVRLVDPGVRSVVRNVLTIAGVVGVLYLVYLLRQPLTWLVLATVLA